MFGKVAQQVAVWTGRPTTFLLAFSAVIIWGVSGPLFGFSDTWQLVINTSTTIITFLMVFLIQSTQNKDTEAMHIKLDELIRCTKGAHTVLLDLEKMDERDLDQIRKKYEDIAAQARNNMKLDDTGTPDILLSMGDSEDLPLNDMTGVTNSAI